MTLLEVVISLAILSGLLVIIFGFFRELSVLNKLTKDTLKESFKSRYMESRLSSVFSHIVNEYNPGKIFYFFTLKDEVSNFPSLIISFDNQGVLDPTLSGDVVGRLFVDQDDRLCLAIWPLREDLSAEILKEHISIECLLEDVKGLSFLFYSAPEPENTVVSTAAPEDNSNGNKESKIPPTGVWMQEWDKAYKQMPVIVKMEVRLKNGPKRTLNVKSDNNQSEPIETYTFVLPSSKHPIKFWSK